MKQARRNSALVECNKKYYAVGGFHNSSIECYDKMTNKWSHIFDMKYTRFHHQATSYNDLIFIFAGCRGNEQYSNKIDVFDPINDNIYELDTKLKIGRENFAFCRTNDYVCLIGGYTKDGETNKVEVLNLKDKTSYIIKNLPYADERLSACILYE